MAVGLAVAFDFYSEGTGFAIILTEILRVFVQSLQANIGTVPYIRPCPLHFISYPIRC
jgi:hypothetical protein